MKPRLRFVPGKILSKLWNETEKLDRERERVQVSTKIVRAKVIRERKTKLVKEWKREDRKNEKEEVEKEIWERDEEWAIIS